MHQQHRVERRGSLALIALGTIVLAFMGISLAITATGTARFVVAMGHSAELGYAVGGVFDVAKAVVPVALLALFARRKLLFFVIIGVAWLGLVTYSSLATHATVTSAIIAIERNGTWKMEGRDNARGELASVERQLATLSQPAPPRPSRTVAEALASERVPAGVWRDANACRSIRMSRHFREACSTVLELRRELVAAEDYERLDARAGELRQALVETPIVATSDPLPATFNLTVGRLSPLDGNAGVALLLTVVVEIMSCFGLAALRVLRDEPGRDAGPRDVAPRLLPIGLDGPSGTIGHEPSVVANLPDEAARFLPRSSPPPASIESRTATTGREESEPPSNVVPMMRAKPSGTSRREARWKGSGSSAPSRREAGTHVREFARARLLPATGMSVGASELRAAYEVWCAAHGHEPLTQQKLGAELTALGFDKWKSSGRIHYKDLQLAA